MEASTLSHITPDRERERRYKALREQMATRGLEALVICGRGDEVTRGRLQYVSDVFQWAGWAFVVLPAEGEAVYLVDPLWGSERADAPGWVGRCEVTAEPGKVIAQVLSELGVSKRGIGLVAVDEACSPAHLEDLKRSAPNAKFSSATELFDGVRAIKSEWEVERTYETAAILHRVYGALSAEIRPGVQERDILAEAHRLVRQHGCLDGIATISRPPFPFFGGGSDRVLQPEDVIAIDLEWAGPSGYWVELRRCFSFGEPSDKAKRFWDLRRESFSACVDAMKPGATGADILGARDRVLRAYGEAPSDSLRYTVHGIGLDSLEMPWYPGHDHELKPGMMLSLHPQVSVADRADRALVSGISISDNILITDTGARRIADQQVEWVTL
ncbi:Xaa-Pro aminopeptidase [Paramicrobacterium agarici]|nr:Xaa-Pro peptidase family protein [Microbacterium agarici]TQO22286.1 Xaa-Pro aminopeptidase [Microbacterium agarici]